MSSDDVYDLVILNGRVMDPETMTDKIANVAIKGKRIAKITNDAVSGKETIDATGCVVAPGFIDTHHHWPYPMGYKLAARDGRTTVLDLELGTHGMYMNQWYKNRVGKCYINYGAGVSHELARAAVLDGYKPTRGDVTDALESRKKPNWSSKTSTLDEGSQILKIMDQGLLAGGLGASSTLGYMRFGVSAREVYEVQKLAGAYGRPSAIHFRGTPGTEAEEVNGIQEMLANAAALNSPAIACHFNNPGYNLVHELLQNLRKRGMNVWGEYYPYEAGCTALNAVFLNEDIWVKKLGNKYEETLADAVTGEFYTSETRNEMLKTEPTRLVVVYKISPKCVPDWVKLPGVAVGSDTMPIAEEPYLTGDVDLASLPNGHPRGAGSFAKVLRLGRENGVPLMFSVASCAYIPAKHLGDCGLVAMQERGRIQDDMIADITIFNPDTVTDKATYVDGCAPSEGIPYVIVAGTVVVDKGEVKQGCHPGEPIRYANLTESRFTPLKEEAWKRLYTVSGCDFGGSDPHQHFLC